MTDFVKKHKVGVALEPQDANPSNPVEGQQQIASSSHSTLSAGLYIYLGATWTRVGNAGATPLSVVSKSANYTLTSSDNVILADATSGDVTLTLPASSGNTGMLVIVKKTNSANDVIIDGNASETIDGDTTLTITAENAYVELICTGSEWIVTNKPSTLIGYIKDVKSTGTNGGTFTLGAFLTRDLNTTEGDFSKFGSLSSNQFTLEPGIYHIDAKAPGYNVSNHRAKLRNITDSTDDILGTTEKVDGSTANGGSMSHIEGEITLTASKTFEIQHRSSATSSGEGFGSAAAYGLDEVYTVVKITKLM